MTILEVLCSFMTDESHDKICTDSTFSILCITCFICTVSVPLYGAILRVLYLRRFYGLPLDQVGNFTLVGIENCRKDTIARCIIVGLLDFAICLDYLFVDTFHGRLGATAYIYILITEIVEMVITLYVLYNIRIIKTQIARRTSVIYLTTRYPSITYHNADVFCDHFGLDVFPVKTFERMQYNKPTLTLYDFEKILTDTRPYIELMNEVKDTSAHLRCLQPITTIAQC